MSENDKYVETYKNEAEELLTEIEHAVLDLEEDAGNRDAIDRLFRAMHTIKGSGAMFGFDDIASFTHHIETVLDKVRNDEIVVNKKLTDLVLASRDQLYEMLYNTEYVDEEAQQKIIKELLSLLPDEAGQKMRINADSSVREEGTLSAKAVIYTYTIEFRPKSGIMMSGMDPVLLLDELRELGECCIQVDDSRLPRLDVFDPQYFYLGWTITLKTTANINIIKDVFIFLDADNLVEIKQIASNEKDVLHPSEVVSKGTIFPGKDRSQKEENDVPRLGEILVEHGVVSMKNLTDALDKQKKLGEILVEDGLIEKDQLSGALKEQSSLFRKQDARRSSGIRVPSERLDKLINLVGELVITQARLTQESGRINDTKLNIPVENIDRLTSELRDIALNIRMRSVGPIFNKFRRLVRDMSANLGKEIDLKTAGEETELDKTLIERLDNPLVHLIRNAVDHGIESPAEREKKGKPRRGMVRLSAVHKGARILITIEDDGRGLDSAVILEKAVSKNMMLRNADLTEKEIFALIFKAGFSTVESVTDVSGRGVGMDVVRREIEGLHGQIHIQSEKGQGTSIVISLPLTLAIIDGLMVEVAGNRYIIPITMVEECLKFNRNHEMTNTERNVFSLRGEMVSLIPLREFFDSVGTHPEAEQVVVVRSDEMYAGIAVDRIIGDYQAVIKSLGEISKKAEGISGATILGDGSVALILDIQSILMFSKEKE